MESSNIEQLSSIALQTMEETIRIQSIVKTEHTPTLEDLQKDAEWVELFSQGYVFVSNMSPDTVAAVEEWDKSDEEKFWYSNCWYFQSGVDRRMSTAYEYGNPSMGKLKYPSVAIFAKRNEDKKSSDVVVDLKEKIAGVIV